MSLVPGVSAGQHPHLSLLLPQHGHTHWWYCVLRVLWASAPTGPAAAMCTHVHTHMGGCSLSPYYHGGVGSDHTAAASVQLCARFKRMGICFVSHCDVAYLRD